MKNVLSNIVPVGTIAGIAFLAFWLLQVAPANVLDALLVLAIALVVLLLIVVPLVTREKKQRHEAKVHPEMAILRGTC